MGRILAQRKLVVPALYGSLAQSDCVDSDSSAFLLLALSLVRESILCLLRIHDSSMLHLSYVDKVWHYLHAMSV